MANQVNYFKVVTLPSSLQPSSFYFLKGAGNSRFKMYLTSDNSTPVAIELDAVPNARTISAVDGLSGGGDLSGNRSLSIDTAWMNARYGRLAFANSWTAKNDFIHSLGIPKVAPVSPTAGVEYLHFGAIGAGGSTPPLVANLTDLQDVSISPANQATDGIVSWSVSAGKFVLGNSITGYIPVSQKAVANGVATLGSNAKIPLNQLPDAILGQVNYQGTYNVSTNSPSLTAEVTPKGHYYVVNVAGTRFGNTYEEGDWIISDGTKWDIVKNSDAVTTVFGRNGNIVANAGDYSAFYEPKFTKNTAFNKIFGTSVGTVAQGNDSRFHAHGNKAVIDGITSGLISNWNAAFGWGDHANRYSLLNHTHTFSSLTSKPNTLLGYGINDAFTKTESDGRFARLAFSNTFTAHNHFDVAVSIPKIAPVSPVAGKEYIHFGTVGSGSSTPPLVANLSDLQDVTISGATNGQVLQWNGTKWINSTIQLDMTAYALKTTRVISGAGLTGGGSLAQDRTLSVNFGTTAGTVVQGNDSRIPTTAKQNEWDAITSLGLQEVTDINNITDKRINVESVNVQANEITVANSNKYKPILLSSGNVLIREITSTWNGTSWVSGNGMALGILAGRDNSGANQTALGYGAGQSNSGDNQSALGFVAGRDNSGANQTALGYYAGQNNSGDNQTALGYFAGRYNSGDYNNIIGQNYTGFQVDNSFTVVASNINNNEITIAGHGITQEGLLRVPATINSTRFLAFEVKDANTLKVTNGDLTANGGLVEVAKRYDQINILGYNLNPTRSNQTILGGRSIFAPESTIAEINDVGAKALTTVEWVNDQGFGRLATANTWTKKNTFTLGLSSSVNATAGNDVPRLSQVTTLITNATSWSQEAW